MRAIDADALIAKCGNWYVEEGTEEGFISDVKHLIDLQPTIEERKDCTTCRYNDYEWYNEPCDSCTGRHKHWKPARKMGKWIERNPKNSDKCRLIECSECGNAYIVPFNVPYEDWIDGRNFCIRCGADLRGEEE